MLCDDVQRFAGPRHSRSRERLGQRWGMTKGKIGFHGGKVDVRRPRVRSDGHEVQLPTWSTAQAEDWLGRWAMNLMLINVSTRKLKRAVRLPEGDLQAVTGDGTSKSAASRRFVALSAERMAEWMASDLSQLDLPVIQIDGLHIGNDLVLVGALGIDGEGNKQPLGLVEGATENAAVVQALIDNLIERGLDPRVCRLFIVDGAKALTKVLRSTFGRHTPIQRCQIYKARNVIERLPKPLHASVLFRACSILPEAAPQSHACGRRNCGVIRDSEPLRRCRGLHYRPPVTKCSAVARGRLPGGVGIKG